MQLLNVDVAFENDAVPKTQLLSAAINVPDATPTIVLVELVRLVLPALAPINTLLLASAVLKVKVLPAPENEIDAPALLAATLLIILIFPAVGETAPPVSPVSVCTNPVPTADMVNVFVSGVPTTVTVVPSPTKSILPPTAKLTSPPLLPVRLCPIGLPSSVVTVSVLVPGLPTVVNPMVLSATVFIFSANAGTGPPLLPVRVVTTSESKSIVMVFPIALVVILLPPRILVTPSTGTAMPASVTKVKLPPAAGKSCAHVATFLTTRRSTQSCSGTVVTSQYVPI